jgi:prolyl 4-hydroxylase
MTTETTQPLYYESKDIPFSKQTSEARAEFGCRVSAKLESNPEVQRVEVRADRPAQIYVVENFLTGEECTKLIAAIDAGCFPSKLYLQDQYKDFRTSQSCDLNAFDPFTIAIEKRISELLGIEFKNGEPLQGQRYQPGQYYKAHSDFFYVDQPYWKECERHGGQRTWTAMIYLNQPAKGGGTGFPYLDIMGTPWPGRMLIWNNMNEDGCPNPWTIHSGEPVEEGMKYIVTKWFRERPYV